jgi:PAS domain S-box-containing protein
VALVSFANRYRCKDGTYKWLQWTATADVSRGLIYAAARDVTAQRQAEETILKSEERYRTVIAAMQDGIVIVDADGSIRSCNNSAERILGLSAAQIIGRTAVDPRWRAIHEDGSPFPAETFPVAVTLRTGRPCTDIVTGVYKPDGALTWISINSRPLLDADGVTLGGVVASFQDITERKRTEAALHEASAELARLGRAQQG